MYTSRISRLASVKPQLLKKNITLVSSTHNYSSSSSSSSLTEKTIEEKYKEKLLEKAKEQGFATIEDLKKNLQDQISEQKKKFNKIDPLKDLQEYQEKMSKNFSKDKTVSQGPIDSSLEQKPFKTLDSYLQVDKIRQLSKQEIEFLWRARFANKDNTLHAVIPQGIFKPMYKNARENPAFVLPLPRELDSSTSATTTPSSTSQGMELHYVQWNFVGPTTVHCMITSLAEYKLHKEYARPHITMSYYTDLLNEDKDIVLMNGVVEPNCNISMQDAQLLLLNLQRFYGCMGETEGFAKKRVQLLRDFTKGGEGFNVELLIELAQSLEN